MLLAKIKTRAATTPGGFVSSERGVFSPMGVYTAHQVYALAGRGCRLAGNRENRRHTIFVFMYHYFAGRQIGIWISSCG